MIEWILPEASIKYDVVNNKILSGCILFTIILCITTYSLIPLLEVNDNTPFILIACLNILLLVLFKYTGSRKLVGNLWIVLWGYILVPMSLQTGGIYSMDFFSLMLLPLMGFALVDYKSGLFWLFCYFGLSFYFCSMIDSAEINDYFRNQTLVFSKNYYLISSLLLSSMYTGVFSVFYFQNKYLIKKLQTKQEDLKSKNKLLKEQADIIVATQRELKRSNQELQEYAYATSHDLKQPIRTVNSFATILKKHLNKKTTLDATSEEMLGFIIAGTDKMKVLTTDILDFATLKLDKEVSFKQLDLNELITSIELDLKKQIEESGVIIQKINLPTADVIPVKINQLFQNLISNAIKFRKKEEQLIIKINAESIGSSWRFSIQDNGIGIEKEYLKTIFKPFKKLHSNAVYEGSGIGLASCMYIISLHHGKMYMDSTFGEGTTCYFTIPHQPSKFSKRKSANLQ